MVYDSLSPGEFLLGGVGNMEQLVERAESDLDGPVLAPQAIEDLRGLPRADLAEIFDALSRGPAGDGEQADLSVLETGSFRITYRPLTDRENRQLGRSTRGDANILVLAIKRLGEQKGLLIEITQDAETDIRELAELTRQLRRELEDHHVPAQIVDSPAAMPGIGALAAVVAGIVVVGPVAPIAVPMVHVLTSWLRKRKQNVSVKVTFEHMTLEVDRGDNSEQILERLRPEAEA